MRNGTSLKTKAERMRQIDATLAGESGVPLRDVCLERRFSTAKLQVPGKRANRKSEVLVRHLSGLPTYRALTERREATVNVR